MSAQTADAQQRMHRTTVLTVIVAVAPLGLVGVVLTSESWWLATIIGLGLLATFLELARWSRDTRPRAALYSFSVGVLVWSLCAVFAVNPVAFLGLALVGALAIPRLPERQVTARIGLAALVAIIGCLYFIGQPVTWRGTLEYLVMPAVLTAFVMGVVALIEKYWLILGDVERAERAEADLGIMRERVRFASDLHDIQGHTLHVVKLKVALARELITADPERAAQELGEVHTLVGETISETKQLAYAQRTLNLSAELENARNLFEAAGIRTRVRRAGPITDGDHELLGQVLRETTTNILRHSQATEVKIEVSNTSVEIVNDGAANVPIPELRGLATLRDRVALAGGELALSMDAGLFTTTARLGTADAPSAPGEAVAT